MGEYKIKSMYFVECFKFGKMCIKNCEFNEKVLSND